MQVPSGRSGQRSPILRRKPESSSHGEQPHADPNDHEASRVDRTGQATEPFSSGSSRRHRKCKVTLYSQTDRCSTSPCNRQPKPSTTVLRDLHGRATGRPLVELLGGQPGRLRAYASSMRRDITTREEAERRARSAGSWRRRASSIRGTGRRETFNAAHQLRNPAPVRRREPAPVREVRQSAWHNYALSAASPVGAHRRRSSIDLPAPRRCG